MNWLFPILLLSAFSVRDPKIEPNPLDYQFSLGIRNANHYFIAMEYERELGLYYHNYEARLSKSYKNILLKERYQNKSSKKLKYNQIDVRYQYGCISIGSAFRKGDDWTYGLSAGVLLNKTFGLLTVALDTDFTIDSEHLNCSMNNIFNCKLKKNLNLVGLIKYQTVKDRDDSFQVKVG